MKESFVIDGFEKLTQQEIFDKAAHHVLSTGIRNVDKHGACSYAGKGCAAAPFIKPEFREKVSGSWPPRWAPHLASEYHTFAIPEHERELLFAIQQCHDGATSGLKPFLLEFKEKMSAVAARFSLSTAALQ